MTSDAALRMTFELVAEKGSPTQDFDALLAPLEQDAPGALDAVRDMANMPLQEEPPRVRDDMEAVRAHARPAQANLMKEQP